MDKRDDPEEIWHGTYRYALRAPQLMDNQFGLIREGHPPTGLLGRRVRSQ